LRPAKAVLDEVLTAAEGHILLAAGERTSQALAADARLDLALGGVDGQPAPDLLGRDREVEHVGVGHRFQDGRFQGGEAWCRGGWVHRVTPWWRGGQSGRACPSP